MRRHRLGRQRDLDTLLIVNHHSAGIQRIVITYWRDLHRFGVFEIHRLQA